VRCCSIHSAPFAFVSVAALLLCGCAHVTNVALCEGGSAAQARDCYSAKAKDSYRFNPKADRETLVIVSFSGGGMRAAALAYGALLEMDTLADARQNNLLDQVDVISSVSGGSVTAGWYALNGRPGLEAQPADNRLWNFLHHDWTGNLAWRGLNPLALGRYVFTTYQRSDMLANFFADELFGERTYNDVLLRYETNRNQPFVVLNASDIGHEIGFAFTQTHFDLLCSNLLAYRVADAVAASANFPFAFSATGIRNYSPCDAQKSKAWVEDGPPRWLAHYDAFDDWQKPSPYSFQLFEVRQARQAKAFIDPAKDDSYVHLLDGGLIDNLGVRSVLALADDPARAPGLYLRLGSMRPEGYQNIRRVLFVVVNARKRDPAGIDAGEYPPGLPTTATRVVDTTLDASILADQDYVASELEATANREIPNPLVPKPKPPFLSDKPGMQATIPKPADLTQLKFYVATIDFDMIPDPKCRAYFWGLATSWGLPEQDITRLINLSKILLQRSVDLRNFYEDVDGADKGPAQLNPVASFAGVCD
jgi:NTE family protein